MQKLPSNSRAETKHLVVLALVLFCPVLVTDFMLSVGFVPISYVIFYSIIWFEPILIIYLTLCALYVVAFYGFAKMIHKHIPSSAKTVFTVFSVLALLLVAMSSRNIYVDIHSGSGERKNFYRLYNDQAKSWEDMQQNKKLMEYAKTRLKRFETSQ